VPAVFPAQSVAARDLVSESRQPQPRGSWGARVREFAFVAVVYVLYSLSRIVAAGSPSQADGNARQILHVESDLHLAPEHWLNRLVSARPWLGIPADYTYATLHYVVTPGVLFWLWRCHRSAYARARWTLLVATLLGLVGFAFLPVAPPRLMPGFIDTMARFSDHGWWGDAASAPKHLGGFTNEYAAMPSLHVGWAVWCSWQIARHARRRWVRRLAPVYATVIALVVMSTANHYLLDAVGGVVVIAVAAFVVERVAAVLRAKPFTRRPGRGGMSVATPMTAFRSRRPVGAVLTIQRPTNPSPRRCGTR
jgi:hypothetical protein